MVPGVAMSLVGALITVTTSVNTGLARAAGSLPATLVIHAVGLATISVVLLMRRQAPSTGKIGPVFFLGGVVGVGTVFSSMFAFAALGASLAVALALLGQTFFAVVVDATGLLGRRRYPVAVRQAPGIALAIAGVAVMAGAWHGSALALLAGLVSGALPGLSFILNAELGRARGVLRSTRVNYITGLAATLVLAAIARPPVAETARAVLAAGPVLVLGGGLMGVVIVTLVNVLFPRLPAFVATILLFSGQALAGVVIDLTTSGTFDARKVAGVGILLVGLAGNALLSGEART